MFSKTTRPATPGQQLSLFEVFLSIAPKQQGIQPEDNPDPTGSGVFAPFFQLLSQTTPSGELTRIRANLAAIQQCRAIQAAGRTATPEEWQVLAQFSGWGALAGLWDETAHAIESVADMNAEQHRWHNRYKTLRQQADTVMNADECERASSSSLSAFYTQSALITPIWELLQKIGFTGGHILDPGAGSGNFIGAMPAKLRAASKITAVEKDPLSAAILSQLYPDVITHASGLENAPLPNESFDLIVGNIPFGDFKVFDAAEREWSKHPIHNYFIGKASRLVAPGGLVCLITSMGTLDQSSKAFRLQLDAARMELLGAIRLPSCTFERSAGTEVTTDVLLFQKRPEGLARTGLAKSFVNTATLRTEEPLVSEEDPSGEVGVMASIEVNQYYTEHPDMMLGEMNFASAVGKGGLYRGDRQTLFLESSSELFPRLNTAVDVLSQQLPDVARRFGADARNAGPDRATLEQHPQLAETIKIHGRLWNKQSIYRSYLKLKNLFFDLLKAEQSQPDAACTLIRDELRAEYTFFTGCYGRLSSNRALNWIEDIDGQFLSVQALEITKPGPDGKPLTTESTILRERVFGAETLIARVDGIEDGLHLSLFNRGRIDLTYISQLTGKPAGQVSHYLLSKALVFADPQQPGHLIEAGAYLSGNVREKLDQLQNRLIDEPELQVNADALIAVLPMSRPLSLISFQLGANWLPLDCLTDWIQTVLAIRVKLTYSEKKAAYTVQNLTGYSAVNQAQGTRERSGLELIEAALNQRSIVIVKTVWVEGSKREVKDIEAMSNAIQQQESLQERFVEWASEQYGPAIETAFNDRFCAEVARQYPLPNRSHYPGASADITLRDHQFSAVERAKEDNGMLAHGVGTGKTWVMITAAMELIRLGKISKAMMAVQNSTVADFSNAWRALYPAAIIYQPTKADLQASNRKRFLQRIATNRFDGIVIPQSFLKLIPDDAAVEEELIRAELGRIDIDDNEDDQSAEAVGARRSGKQRIKAVNKLKAKIEARRYEQASRKTDQILNFSQLGIDALFLDEAHKYKRMGFYTSRYQIKGIDTAGSQDAFQAMVKCRTILNKSGKVWLATGTPISNTMAEAWTMLRFTDSDRLEKLGLSTFDQFCGTFCKVVPVFELTTSGNFKTVERLAQFVNVAQLSAIYRQSVDVVMNDEVREFQSGELLPTLKLQPAERPETQPGEQPEVEPRPAPGYTRNLLTQTEGVKTELAEIRATLRWFENLSGGDKRKHCHIPLVMYGRAKKATLDIRLLDPSAPDEAGNKTSAASREIFRIYTETSDVNGTQLVFCDVFRSSANVGSDEDEAGGGTPQFNLFDEITRKLVAMGIPADQIAQVPADKNKREPIFEKLRAGVIRVALGSSERMGIGVNVQERLAAVHHLDAPNRPTDFEQRNGRLIRQGNLFAAWKRAVEIVTYGVEKTLDATSYGRLAIKQKFINQVLRGGSELETMTDVGDDDEFSAMNFEQMMATLSGSQTALVYTAKNHELTRLCQQKKAWQRGLMNAQTITEQARQRVSVLTGLIPRLGMEAEIVNAKFAACPVEGEGQREGDLIKTLAFDGVSYSDRKEWGQPLDRFLAQVKSAARRHHSTTSAGLLTINGLDLALSGELTGYEDHSNRAIYSVNYSWGANLKGQINNGFSLTISLRAAVNRTLKATDIAKEQLTRARQQIEAFGQTLNQPFKKQAQLDHLTALVAGLKRVLETEARQHTDPPATGDEETFLEE